ncbi:hypothetical protein [Duganella violaceipulchra]|uniref:Type II secretory pathway pseudopilin PulG n=1 Tax=Duganella violaceipulchra TaxID=2849652 RepID=A0AA41L3N6_9BURK|nr:hypothetical protein [Duganella violaceicalia]MBV6319962.1 hypothetical protein [Duganella violaceicalia]MCP2010326.1 type II secretory pathway pseudopilin PulG [Duganella violaceicalia]
MTPAPLLARQRGAALLVLVTTIGLGAAVAAINSFNVRQGDQRRERETLLTLSAAREALTGFALRNGRLPRPAISATDGREREADCADEIACTGLLPWKALGIPATDAWGKRLRYSVTPPMSRKNFSAVETVATKRLVTRNATGEKYFLLGRTVCEVTAQCAPAIVYSSGRKNFGVTEQGARLANGAARNIDEQHNDSASNDFIVRPGSTDSDVPGGEFDDLVVWLSLPTLYQQMARAGALR